MTYLVPWICEDDLRTELLLNVLQEPPSRRGPREVRVTQRGQNGECVRQLTVTVLPEARTIVPLERSGDATYGICLVEPVSGQQHIQLFDRHTVAITHGRACELHGFAHQGMLARVGRRLAVPYSKTFNALIRGEYGAELLVFNISDEPGPLYASRLDHGNRALLGRIPGLGSLRVNVASLPIAATQDDLRATALLEATFPFNYYVLACCGAGSERSYSIQHVK